MNYLSPQAVLTSVGEPWWDQCSSALECRLHVCCMVHVCCNAKIISARTRENLRINEQLNFVCIWTFCVLRCLHPRFQLIQREGWMPGTHINCLSIQEWWDLVFWAQAKFNTQAAAGSFIQDWTLEGEPQRSQRSYSCQWRQVVLTMKQSAEVKFGHWWEPCAVQFIWLILI